MPEDERRRLARLKANLERRALIIELVRTFFREQAFLEVETPVRVPVIAPEACITPLHSEGWFLSTSPELHMKRLLAAGYKKLFQLSRCFRKGEQGRHHNPEFTMLEWYRAGGDYRQMMSDTETLVISVARGLGLGQRLSYQGCEIDLTLPWPRTTVAEAFRRYAGWDPVKVSDADRFDADLLMKVIPAFDPHRPIIVMDYPAPMASLARLKPGQKEVAERAEVFIGGLELANAYSELVDAPEQTRRFAGEIERIRRERGENTGMPDRFIEAVPYLPECGGIALGLDRLVMLLCDAYSIEVVMAFTAETA